MTTPIPTKYPVGPNATRVGIVIVLLKVPAAAGTRALHEFIASCLPQGHPWEPQVAAAVLPVDADAAAAALKALDEDSPPTKPEGQGMRKA